MAYTHQVHEQFVLCELKYLTGGIPIVKEDTHMHIYIEKESLFTANIQSNGYAHAYTVVLFFHHLVALFILSEQHS